MKINTAQIKNIIVFRNDRFGEFLLNIPSLRALKETFVNARLIAVVSPYVKELAGRVPFIDEIIEWDSVRQPFFKKINFINQLRKKKIDIAVMLNPVKDFHIFAYLSGIPVRVGYNRKWGFLLTHKIQDKKHLGESHEIDYNLRLVSLIGAHTKDNSLSLSINGNEADTLLKDLNLAGYNNLVALHPWTSDSVKQWPFLYFRGLAERLTGQGIRIIVVGGKSELAKSGELFGKMGANLIDLTGKTTLIQLAGILKRCKLLISGDSGPVHLACAVGTKVLAVFRNDIPGKAAKRWGPCGKGDIVIEKNNLSDITVSEVLNKIEEALK
ncbi:MAG: glycosyltransferase family 9 protein [Candidatus Omnitrophica bacterium]|nr:glycosyltransferase family 9 protein [Candidatus Omnitrophota bacterium]